MYDNLPDFITHNTVLPLFAAPMFLVSGPDLVLAACRAGVIGAFPAPNTRTIDVLDGWFARITAELEAARMQHPAQRIAPWAINLIVHRSYKRREAELDLVIKYKAPIVITALGSPREIVDPVHEYGGLVFADVNSVKYARKAAEAGVDGLVLVAAGAGGHTGQMTGFAFVDAVREFWDGMIVLAGGISTGRAIRAAQTLGADLAYMGTRFIATRESLASDDYRQMLVEATIEDIVTSDALTGVHANWLIPSLQRAGYTPDKLQKKGRINFDDPLSDVKAWRDTWSAGQGVGTIKQVQTVAELVADLQAQYQQAIRQERQGDAWTDPSQG
ncbi:MAG: NAD(P)H-dependent flavin oxidoreductase [Ardenticatenaceae bacterium]